MLLSLVDVLRCPADHVESALVLSVEDWSGQRIAQGVLGCPVCHARYPIHNSAVDFTGAGIVRDHPSDEDPPDTLRLAAQLSLSDPGGIVLLTGHYAAAHGQLAEMADVTCLLVDGPAAGSRSVKLEVGEKLPLVNKSLRGAAVSGARRTTAFLAEVGRCLVPGGRIVVTKPSSPPITGRLVAEDDREWVAEIEDSRSTVQLRRARTD